MNVILLGPPGSGKGTQCSFISKTLDYNHISTGEILRSSKDKEIKKLLMQGKLVSDDLIMTLVNNKLENKKSKRNFIFDGVPRTLKQAKMLSAMGVFINHTIVIAVNEELLLRRILGRRIHRSSGRLYHVDDNPPKIPNLDDVTGEELEKRSDDNETSLRERMVVYNDNIEKVISFYKVRNEKVSSGSLSMLEGGRKVCDINSDILKILRV